MKPWKFEEKKKNYQIYRSFDGRVESKNFGKFWKNFGIFWKINIFWNCPITTIAQNSYLIWSDTLLVCHSEWPKDKPFLLMHSRHARNLYDSKIKIIFETVWTLFKIILFIHFYPLKKAPGQSQKLYDGSDCYVLPSWCCHYLVLITGHQKQHCLSHLVLIISTSFITGLL